MKVIFKATGEIKSVSFGHAVNYLLPKGLAVKATDKNIEELKIKKLKEKEIKDKKAGQEAFLFSQFSGKDFTIKVKAGKKGKLYGALTKKDIARKLGIEKQSVILAEPIKKTGDYELELKFGASRAKIKLKVENDQIKSKIKV